MDCNIVLIGLKVGHPPAFLTHSWGVHDDYNGHHLKCHKILKLSYIMVFFLIIDHTSYRGQNYRTNTIIIVRLATLWWTHHKNIRKHLFWIISFSFLSFFRHCVCFCIRMKSYTYSLYSYTCSLYILLSQSFDFKVIFIVVQGFLYCVWCFNVK